MRVGRAPQLGLQERMASKGVRVTPQRLRVLEALASERDDATAQQIHRRLVDAGVAIGLATVYRTLAILSEQGLVDALSHRPGELCYRLCADTHHHHLVCTACHRVLELHDCELEGWIDEVASAHGWLADDHRLEVTGVCGDCRAAAAT
jgi:Fur family ferric uptake transcriptional regulator